MPSDTLNRTSHVYRGTTGSLHGRISPKNYCQLRRNVSYRGRLEMRTLSKLFYILPNLRCQPRLGERARIL